MIVVGLTGGIASGKTFIGSLLRRRGVPVIDADHLAREVVRRGTEGFDEVIRAFPEVLLHGDIDRPALARIIYADPIRRRKLEEIIHPRVRAEFLRQKAQLSDAPLVIYEVPLLYEKGLESEMDAVIVVDVPEEIQKERLMRRSGLGAEEADQRISSQMSRVERLSRADFILSGLLTEEETEIALDDLLPKIVKGSKNKKGGIE
ncbi:MAG: dephospho-CoA kinase [Nitrospirae bacterium]|nr:dephospho-CoA kinase [Nitrospirota bacterium]